MASPPDALQADLAALVELGKEDLRAGNLEGFRQAEADLAYLCAPSAAALREVGRATHGGFQTEGLAVHQHWYVDVVRILKGYPRITPAGRRRARAALRELRAFKQDWDLRTQAGHLTLIDQH